MRLNKIKIRLSRAVSEYEIMFLKKSKVKQNKQSKVKKIKCRISATKINSTFFR